MKNIIIVVLILLSIFLYFNNSQNSQDVMNAKRELGIETETETEDSVLGDAKKEVFKQIDETIGDVQEVFEEEEVQDEVNIEIKPLTEVQFLELNEINPDDVSDGEIELTGNTLVNVEKIRVTYSNTDSDFPDDDFTLRQYKSGDDTFLYRAFSRYETFDYGENIYTFYAYSGSEISETQLIIKNPKEQVKEDGENNGDNTSAERIDISSLPVGSEYGTPTKLSESKITYSGVKGFELEKVSTKNIACESNFITDKIVEKTGAWSWWNTCRPGQDEKYVSVYALNMVDGEYVYAKHYIGSEYYATIELSSGLDPLWENLETVSAKNEWLQAKNNELKVLNETFGISEITDELFINITQ